MTEARLKASSRDKIATLAKNRVFLCTFVHVGY